MAPFGEQDAQEAGSQRDRRQPGPHQTPKGDSSAELRRAAGLHADVHEPHPRRLAGKRPEEGQIGAARDQPGSHADDERGRRRVTGQDHRGDQRDHHRHREEDGVEHPQVESQGHAPCDQAGAVGGLRTALAPHQPPCDTLDGIIQPARHPPDLPGDVLHQPHALSGHRRSDLGSLRDPLDQLLSLVAGQQALPDGVDQLAVEGVDQRPLDRWTVERSLHGLLHGGALKHPHQRPLDRGALDGAHDCLLGGGLDRSVDPRRFGHPPGASGAAAQEPSGKRP